MNPRIEILFGRIIGSGRGLLFTTGENGHNAKKQYNLFVHISNFQDSFSCRNRAVTLSIYSSAALLSGMSSG